MRAEWTDKQKHRWREFIEIAIDFLEDVCDMRHPVKVWRVRWARQFGSAQWDGERFIIRIANRLQHSEAVWTLIHELAHVASWDEDDSESGHGIVWGMAESAMIRLYEEWE